MIKYSLEFILHTYNVTASELKNALTEFVQDLSIGERPAEGGSGSDYGVKLVAEDPTLIFDICSQFGRIKSVKVDEIKV